MLSLFLTACGHSHAYENGYEMGVQAANSNLRPIVRMDPNADISGALTDYYVEAAYEAHKSSVIGFSREGEEEEDYHEGFIDGYTERGEEIADGNL